MELDSTKLTVVPLRLKVTFDGSQWQPVFTASSNTFLKNPGGELDFSGHNAEVLIVITLVDSPGVRFPSDASSSIGFQKDICPRDANPKESNLFHLIAVSEDGMTLAFLNNNTQGSKRWYYGLFPVSSLVPNPPIIIDPPIINR